MAAQWGDGRLRMVCLGARERRKLPSIRTANSNFQWFKFVGTNHKLQNRYHFSKTFRVGYTVLKVKRAMKNSIYLESQSDPHGTYP